MGFKVNEAGERGWTLAQWQAAWRGGELDLQQVMQPFLAGAADPAWISRLDQSLLAVQLEQLQARLDAVDGDLQRLPLYGVPFAIKDNIDAAGWITTAGCPAFAYRATQDATTVARLRAAGAILVGKTNLDQFATGLVGTRSPYGEVPNAINPDYVSGGSSSGSAVAVARGWVPFSLGTDTAGSGRVPAAFNNIVGLKPTRGWLSTAGVVPACRTLDCVSVFALTVADAWQIANIAGGYDPADPYSRADVLAPSSLPAILHLAYPAQLDFKGDAEAERCFNDALDGLRAMGAQLTAIDFTAFRTLAALLYEGPWVAERYTVIEQLLQREPSAVHPVVRQIVESAGNFSACDAFRSEYRRADLARQITQTLGEFDALVVPTTPSIFTREQLREAPIALNSRLGEFTNFTNLADLSALAVPAGWRGDGLPVGITFIANAGRDETLARIAQEWQSQSGLSLGATGRALPEQVDIEALPTGSSGEDSISLAVVGAHLTGMPLNHQLTSRHARLLETTRTQSCYRLYALAGTVPPKPGLVRAAAGQAIDVEVWSLSPAAFASFVAEVPAPLGIGTLELADGRQVKGFICEPCALDGATDITEFGGWRAYRAAVAG